MPTRKKKRTITRTAMLSSDEMYRYQLGRSFGKKGKTIGYFGCNPSTADALVDDQTVKKWMEFTRRHGGYQFLVGNVFAYRATDVRELVLADDPVGPANAEHVTEIISQCDLLVPCWGNSSKVPKSLRHQMENMLVRLLDSGKPVLCFGKTKSGDPVHPLMLGYDTELVPWS